MFGKQRWHPCSGPRLEQPEKTADVWRRYWWFPRQMTCEKQAQKFHTEGMSLPRSWYCFLLVVPHGKFDSANQKHYPDLGSDASSVWNLCARFSDVIWQGNQGTWQCCQMSAVFSGYLLSAGLNDLLELTFRFPLILIGKSMMAF